ncbi:hypothetical protein BH10ACI4_BH10ACI4_22810 [soil metagenome]
MKYASLLYPLLFTAVLAPPVSPEVAAYRARMDHAQDLQDSIRDELDNKNGKGIASLSAELTTLLQEDGRYWEKHKVPDAIVLSGQSIASAKLMGEEALAGRIPQATDAFNKLQSTCRACHDAHPEKRVAP